MTTPLISIQRANTILYCRRWPETVHFYKETLRLPVVYENDWLVELQQTADSFLTVANSAWASIQDVGGQGITITWQVEDVDQARKCLTALGIPTTDIKRRWDARVFYFHDPEGHRLEMWTAGDGESGDQDG